MARDGIGRDSIFLLEDLRLMASAVVFVGGGAGVVREVRDLS